MVVVATWNVENLYRPGSEFGPPDEKTYRAKLAALAMVIADMRPDVLALQEIGDELALSDLASLLEPDLGHLRLRSSKSPDGRGIRVAVLSRFDIIASRDWSAFPRPLRPVQISDSETIDQMGRGALHVRVIAEGEPIDIVTCHLKSKLISYPGGRFQPHNEGERGRYACYALARRAAEAFSVRRLADWLLDGAGRDRAVVVLGDLNDEERAATTQILQGPPGSEIGTPAEDTPDKGDGWRLWNLAARIEPPEHRFSRVYQGRPELIDHILVSHRLKNRVLGVRSLVDRKLPSVTDNPAPRRDAEDSDHAPVVATFS